MSQDIKNIKGVGPNKANILKKEIGCQSIEELLYYFPRTYVDRTIIENPNLEVGKEISLLVYVRSSYLHHGRASRFLCQCYTVQKTPIQLVWFRGARYIQKLLKKDNALIVSGKLEYFRGLQISHPDFEIISEEASSFQDLSEKPKLINSVHIDRIIPIYPLTENLKKKHIESRSIRAFMNEALQIERLREILPIEIIQKYNLMERQEAIRNIHFPASEEKKAKAWERFKYEELYCFHMLMYHKYLLRKKTPRILKPKGIDQSISYKKLIEKIEFTLTNDQKLAIDTFLIKCQESYPQSFLLQGDVGSGKTLVALGIILHYLDAGIQSALLAPTAVLARQHFHTISQFLPFEISHQIELLIGSDLKKLSLEKKERIVNGDVNIIIGTHSLFQKDVIFANLGLLVIDEQQRFGVKQRDTLIEKGKKPDMIAMSATPIPRTLCLSNFADTEFLSLREKPKGRKDIQTMFFRSSKRKGVYASIKKYVEQGQQCYIIYPIIDESEVLDLQAAKEGYQHLRTEIFPNYQIALLHGKLKDMEKKEIMDHFQKNKIQILVSTSIVEVGVDVPNATIMLIEHAERFGISQLHQLRGRVGRGTKQSFCVLMSDSQITESKERLAALEQSNDGFYLAEKDLEIRGAGQMTGIRQHGMGELKLADFLNDKELNEKCYEDVRKYSKPNSLINSFIQWRFSKTN